MQIPEDAVNNYNEWVKYTDIPPMTNTQAKFAMWLLQEDNLKILSQIGQFDHIFDSIYKWAKHHKSK